MFTKTFLPRRKKEKKKAAQNAASILTYSGAVSSPGRRLILQSFFCSTCGKRATIGTYNFIQSLCINTRKNNLWSIKKLTYAPNQSLHSGLNCTIPFINTISIINQDLYNKPVKFILQLQFISAESCVSTTNSTRSAEAEAGQKPELNASRH